MGNVTGPVSTLPGAIFKGKGTCDNHHNRDSIYRVQGETDSFGSEMIDMCQECFDKYQEQMDQTREECCEWCGKTTTDCKPTRDIDEGFSGPVYTVCRACRKKQQDAIEKEWYERDHY